MQKKKYTIYIFKKRVQHTCGYSIYINIHSLEKIHLNSTIKVQFCIMYNKLFILESFFFFLNNFGAKCEITS